MFDDETPKEKSSTDWTGPIIVAMLAPLFFLLPFWATRRWDLQHVSS